MPEIADYDKQQYDYGAYWQDTAVKRDYEDRAERIAIRRLLPRIKKGVFFLDLGGGFGRLTGEYAGHFDQLILADYSMENLKKYQVSSSKYQEKNSLQAHLIALNAYHLPFRNNSVAGLQTVRMMHHIEDPDRVLSEISRVLQPDHHAIIEYANKRHALAILKKLAGRGKINPFSLEPADQSDLFYNFHPRWIEEKTQNAKLKTQKVLSVSNFRHQIFKKILPLPLLLLLEKVAQVILAPIRFAPSVFLLTQKHKERTISHETSTQDLQDILQCPKCQSTDLDFEKNTIVCQKCQKTYPIVDGIYDFRI